MGELVRDVEILLNVWLGTSVENADVATRIDLLRSRASGHKRTKSRLSSGASQR
ncbi:hypothetical protein JQ621_25375 [Bradyrhizobium manausense]|uniref:hypothetical protein n=1 Tax=Bradyrhizobium manausense TaxID=989370 RepID=UPI001BA991C2|nr:hypothetical protein [Bradyrhizobium manausense]MBR1090806.1 hypothetical protein [Bradyrhizobium manausense]